MKKTRSIAKVILLSLFLTVFALNASAQKVTLSFQNETFEKVLSSIKQQTGLLLVFSEQLVDLNRKVSIDVNSIQVEDALKQLLKGTNLSFEIKNNKLYFVEKKSDEPKDTPVKSKKITGLVTDEKGIPIIGATVKVKNSNQGTITDVVGKFSLDATNNAVLSVSYIGFINSTIPVLEKNYISIILIEDSRKLDEVVVIGYGTVRKSDLTGSVTSIKTDQIQNMSVNKIGELLQGRSTGLQIVNNSDDAESSMSARIRGASSIKGSREPLVVLDGIPFGSLSALNQINPSNIESVEILKDASAAAIYGSQGANGVILVTSKKGKAGTAEVFVESSYTVSQYTKDFERWTDMAQMAKTRNLSMTNDGMSPLFNGQTQNGVYYPSVSEFENGIFNFNNWLPITRNVNPIIRDVKAGIRGGTLKNRYQISLNYFDQQGSVKGDTYDKQNIYAKDAIDVTDNLKVEFSVILNNVNKTYGTGGSIDNSGRPWYKSYNDDGSLFIPYSNYIHPLQQKADNFNNRKDVDLLTNCNISWKVTPWLTFNSVVSYNSIGSTYDYYLKSKYTLLTNSYKGYGSVTKSTTDQTYFTNTLTFDKIFGKIHKVNVMIGRDDQVKKYNSIGIIGKDFVTDVLLNENLTLATVENQEITQGYSREDLQSYFTRANYILNDKYLFTFTFRADGSSKFGQNNKWGYFPAAALAWKVNEEDFLKDNNVVSNLKLRVSAGETGNQGISPYQTFERYGNTTVYDWEHSTNLLAAGPSSLGTPDLKWETTTQYAAGIESGFLKNRLRFNVDAYFKHTTDLIRDKILPSSSGFNNVLVNDGIVDNWGLECELASDIVSTKDISFSANLLFSMNRNKVVDIGTAENAGLITDKQGNKFVYADEWGGTVYAVGKSMNSFYGYINNGPIRTSNQMPFGYGSYKSYGDLNYQDLNNNGLNDESDRTLIGDPTPSFISSLNLSFRYKKIDLNLLFNGVFGNDVLDLRRDDRPYGQINGWSLDNQATNYHQVRNSYNKPFSSFYIVDGSFLRLQTLSVGYNIEIPNQKILKRGRVFCNISNLFIITNHFEGYDPEVGVGGVLEGGYDVDSGSPRQRRITLGLNLTL